MSTDAEFEALVCEVSLANATPDAALRSLVAYAPALSERVEALMRRRTDGQWLYPGEDNLLFYGLFVLAAARMRAFWPVWACMLTEAEWADEFFGDGHAESVASISLGLGDEAPADIAALAANPDVPELARVGLLNALARLTCEGAYPRTDFLALIDTLAVLGAASDPEARVWALQEAIALGGVWERLALLDQLWDLFPDHTFREVDREDTKQLTKAAARNPADMERFETNGIAAPTDPTDGLQWLKRIEERDPTAKDVLNSREREWLSAYLRRTTPSRAAMRFEELDGYFHALALGPELVMPSRYLPQIWDENLAFDDEVQTHRVLGLLQRHWNAIARRNIEFVHPVLWIEAHEDSPPGQVWAQGFMRGVSMCADAWQALGENEVHLLVLQEVSDLTRGDLAFDERAALLDELTANVMGLGQYWQGLRLPHATRTATKIGRNAPCPCGSGRKWKKCCGASAPPTDMG